MILSPSSIAIAALGLPPSGALLNGDSLVLSCSVCGAAIGPGAVYDRLALPPSFTNHLSVATPGGHHICGACKTVMATSDFQMRFATGLYCSEGFFPLMRKEHRAWAFLTPPEPPFVIAIQTAKQQHVVWRAPVSLSRDLILVRVGEQIVRLRRPSLIVAREAVVRLHDARKAADGGKQKKATAPAAAESLESPFVTDWKFQSSVGGVLKNWAATLIAAGAVSASDKAALSLLNAGEIWALQAVLHLQPVRPDPLSIDESNTAVAA